MKRITKKFRDLTADDLERVIGHLVDDLHDMRVDEAMMEADGTNVQPAMRGLVKYLRSIQAKRERVSDECAE